MTAVDSAGNHSADSAEASATPEAEPTPEPPAASPDDLYVWDIAFDSITKGKNGKHHSERIEVVVRRDSDGNGVAEGTDILIKEAVVTIELRDTTGDLVAVFTGTTNGEGVFRTDWVNKLDKGTYTAEVTGLTHSTFAWGLSLDPNGNDTDLDGGGLPDQQHFIPH